jgi:hypothetical protein
MHFAVFAVAVALGTRAWIGVDGKPVEPEDANQNHSDEWSCQKKSFPIGLKGDSLHADPLV